MWFDVKISSFAYFAIEIEKMLQTTFGGARWEEGSWKSQVEKNILKIILPTRNKSQLWTRVRSNKTPNIQNKYKTSFKPKTKPSRLFRAKMLEIILLGGRVSISTRVLSTCT